MPEFGSWASHWWKPVLFVIVAGHFTNVCVTLFLHRAQTHRGVKFHPLAEIPIPVPEEYETPPEGDPLRYTFGERPPCSLEDGLQRMATWVKQHGARASKKFEGVEVTKNFPKAWLM